MHGDILKQLNTYKRNEFYKDFLIMAKVIPVLFF